MKTISVLPEAAGWLVDAEMTGGYLHFLEAEDAERKAYQLGGVMAKLGLTVQVLVRDMRGLTICSAVLGPGAGTRLSLVHGASGQRRAPSSAA